MEAWDIGVKGPTAESQGHSHRYSCAIRLQMTEAPMRAIFAPKKSLSFASVSQMPYLKGRQNLD